MTRRVIMQKADDPLHAPHLRGPGVWETVRSLVAPPSKMFDVLQIEVTSACLANCSYCPRTVQRERWKNAYMSDQTYANAWPLFRQARRVHLQGWGEPLLHRRFFDFVELARRADCQVSTTSCGLLMNEGIAAKLSRSGVDIIAFSLAGTDQPGNASRGEDAFERVTQGIHILQKTRKALMAVHLEIHIAYMLLASRIEDLRGLPGLLGELDAHAAVVSTLDFIPSADMAHEAFMPWEQDKIAHARAVLEEVAAQARADGRAVFYSLPVPEARDTCLEHIERSLYISSDGSISPCIYVNLPTKGEDPLRRVYGNLNHDDPLGIWASPGYQAFRRGLATREPDANCRDCPKRYAVGNRE